MVFALRFATIVMASALGAFSAGCVTIEAHDVVVFETRVQVLDQDGKPLVGVPFGFCVVTRLTVSEMWNPLPGTCRTFTTDGGESYEFTGSASASSFVRQELLQGRTTSALLYFRDLTLEPSGGGEVESISEAPLEHQKGRRIIIRSSATFRVHTALLSSGRN